jgi:HD-GYP domain-containing protein (c-di-GMP phosphodiesterase class II)
VADVFDALSADSPYRAAMPISKALSILDADAGSAFDPACIAALKSGLAKLNAEMAA